MDTTFRNLGIAPSILAALDKLSFTTPTPIQLQAIAPAIAGKDIVGIAQTGTGKTLAFGIPVIQHLISQGASRGGASGTGRALILLPTRELALQVDETLQKVGGPLGIRTALLIGGAAMGPQINALRRGPGVVIATPGRLLDHLEQKMIRLDSVTILVLDEADRMLDMGFAPQIKRILVNVPANKQTMLFSASFSPEILAIATKTMKLPLQIEVAPQGTTSDRVTQELFMVRREDKLRLLEKILQDYRGSTLVFARTKHGASQISHKIESMGHTTAAIHGNKSLSQRKMALAGFKAGKYRVLVATDIVARGIDVKGVELVINYDLPMQSADYVHRIGRTARAGAEGHAISFMLPDQKRDVLDIERLIRKEIKLSPLPVLPPPTANTSTPVNQPVQRSFRGGGRPSSRPSYGSRSSGPSHSGSSPHRGGPGGPRPSRSPGGRPSYPSRFRGR
jgi:ATP-dependent RNA helicase RhlE